MSNHDKHKQALPAADEPDPKRARPVSFSYTPDTNLAWEVPRALAELIANALDEDNSTHLALEGSNNTCTIRNLVKDGRPGLTRDSFNVKTSKRDLDAAHGKFGYGLKDALVCLRGHQVMTVAQSRAGKFVVDPQKVLGSDETMLADYFPTEGCREQETIFTLHPITQDQFASAKRFFCRFHPDLELVGEVMNRAGRKLRVYDNHTSGAPLFFVNGFLYKMDAHVFEEKKKFFFAYDIGYKKADLKNRDRDQLPANWHAKVTAYVKVYANLPETLLKRIQALFTLSKEEGKAYWEHGRSEFGDAAARYTDRLIAARAEQEKKAQECQRQAREKEESAASLREQLVRLRSLSISSAQDSSGEDLEFDTHQALLADEMATKQREVERLELDGKRLRDEQAQLQRQPSEPIFFSPSDSLSPPVGMPANATVLSLPRAVEQRLAAIAPRLRSCESHTRVHLQKQLQALCSHLAIGVQVSVAAMPDGARFQATERKLLLSESASITDDMVLSCALKELWQHYSALNFSVAVEWLAKLTPVLPPPARSLSGPPAEAPRDKPRFLFVCDEWGTNFGGISAVNIQMARDMAKLSNLAEVHALITDQQSALTDEEVAAVLRTDKVTLLFPMVERARIVGVRGCPSIDVVVAHGEISGPVALQLKLLPQFATARYWLFNHTDPEAVDQYKPRGTSSTTSAFKVKKLVHLAAQFDAIFSVGSFIHDSWKRSYAAHGVHVSHRVYYPPLNPFFFRELPRSVESLTSIRILLFGRVGDATHYFKGIDIACEAAKRFAQRLGTIKQVELVVRGIPASLIQEQFTNLLKHTGGLIKILPREYGFQEDIKKDLYSSDICIVPARYEPYGLTGLEAIAAQTPILVSANTGLAAFLRDFLGATDLVVDATFDTAAEAEADAAERFAQAMFKMFQSGNHHILKRMARLHEDAKGLFLFPDPNRSVLTYEDLVAFSKSSLHPQAQ